MTLMLLTTAPALAACPSGVCTLSIYADIAHVGMADLAGDGTSAKVAVMCWRNGNTGVETLVRLRTDMSTGGLNAGVEINGDLGADTIKVIRASGSTLHSDYDCASDIQAGTTWDPPVTNGYWIDLSGSSGNDLLEGPGSSEDTILSGGGNDDDMYNYSTIGSMYGGAGNDDLISSTTGGSDYLLGEGDNDCLYDTSNSVATSSAFNCGTGASDQYHNTNSSIQINCESSATCCGFC